MPETSQQTQAKVDKRKSPSGKILYGAIVAEAEEELDRPSSGLFWSGLAAGLSMGFSIFTMALIHSHLPHEKWAPLLVSFGYSLGFLVVILGRQQLFTENTLTPILPLLRRPSVFVFFNVLRLWIVVFVANMIGACAMALVLAKCPVLPEEARKSLIELSMQGMHKPFGTMVLRAIYAGWLIALIVWLLPFAEAARIWVIIIITYVVSLAELPHSVAGAVEAFITSWHGDASWPDALFGYIAPTLIGNAIGGVTLVAALNHAQVLASGESLDTAHQQSQQSQQSQPKDTGLP
ncbi:MAG TPA: formate/nitrite transporter family protein [Phycisphaerae bacterium]|jgi:formate/nitrite transporter FocA (FNT family)|nr:formate/nitrite transporter family protein [Phycisphaerae bacterium]